MPMSSELGPREGVLSEDEISSAREIAFDSDKYFSERLRAADKLDSKEAQGVYVDIVTKEPKAESFSGEDLDEAFEKLDPDQHKEVLMGVVLTRIMVNEKRAKSHDLAPEFYPHFAETALEALSKGEHTEKEIEAIAKITEAMLAGHHYEEGTEKINKKAVAELERRKNIEG